MAIKFQDKTGEITVKDSNGTEQKVSFGYKFLVNNSEARPTLEELNSEFTSLQLDLGETLRGAINDFLKSSEQDKAVSIVKLKAEPDKAKSDAKASIDKLVLAGIMTAEQAEIAKAAIK